MATPDSTRPRSPKRPRLSSREVSAYGCGNFAFALLGLVLAVNLQYFYTDYVGLSAGLVSWSLLFARMFDAVTDPVMAWVSDGAHTRLGRRRPFILASAIPMGLSFYFLFSPPEWAPAADHQTGLLAYLLGLYVLTYGFWTVGAVPYFSLGAELADDYDERTRVIAVREAWALAGLLLATILPAWLIDAYGGRTGYSFMGAILGVGTTAFLLLSGALTRERPEFMGRSPLGPYQGWRETLRNPHFRQILLAFGLNSIAAAVPAVLVIYVSVYVIGTPDWWAESVPGWLPTWSYYLLVYFGSAVLALPGWAAVSRRIGKRATWGIAIVMAALSFGACAGLEEGAIGYFTVVLAVAGAAYGNALSLPSAIVADLIDWDEARTGKRREGSYFALWAVVRKFGDAFTGFAALQILDIVGYDPGAEQSEEVKRWMIGMFSWFPALFYALAGIALLRFRFGRRELAEIQRRLGRT